VFNIHNLNHNVRRQYCCVCIKVAAEASYRSNT